MAVKRTGAVVWFTGLSGAGKSTIADFVAAELRERGLPVEVLDGDLIRENLSKGLGFSKEDRDTNIRRIGFVAELLARHGVIVLVAAISPYREVRDEVHARIDHFVEVYVEASLDALVDRDVKGLYRRAIAGEIEHFTGVSDPYEAPLRPDIHIHTDGGEGVATSAGHVLLHLEERGLIPAANGSAERAGAVP